MTTDQPPQVITVAPHLRPSRTFDAVSGLVIDYLTRTVPLGMWAVTRIVDGHQIMLTVDAPAYEVRAGDEFQYSSSLCRSMVAGRAPRIAPDIGEVPEYAAAAQTAPIAIGAYVGTPIARPDGTLFGTVCGCDPAVKTDDLLALQPLLDLLSTMLSAVVDADLAVITAERALEVARCEADTDALTGLLNRRGWDRYLQLEEQRYRRFGDTASVVVLDLDNLKAVNDKAGHDAGDRYIRRAADVLAAARRAGDVLARLGGDEFGIIAVGANTDQAQRLVQRLEDALDRAGVSGSFGHAPYSVVTGFPGAWNAADTAMYEQKQRRRGTAPARPLPAGRAAVHRS